MSRKANTTAAMVEWWLHSKTTLTASRSPDASRWMRFLTLPKFGEHQTPSNSALAISTALFASVPALTREFFSAGE